MIHDLARQQLFEIRDLIRQLSDAQLSLPLEVLHGATLGMHYRHILEFYQCLFQSMERGMVNYDLRRRNRDMERSTDYCESCISELIVKLETIQEDFPMELAADYAKDENKRELKVSTTYYRELLYNVEHCVHHLAIIKIGIKELDSSLPINEYMGVAASTIRSK